jgi:hypothetical protein
LCTGVDGYEYNYADCGQYFQNMLHGLWYSVCNRPQHAGYKRVVPSLSLIYVS